MRNVLYQSMLAFYSPACCLGLYTAQTAILYPFFDYDVTVTTVYPEMLATFLFGSLAVSIKIAKFA